MSQYPQLPQQPMVQTIIHSKYTSYQSAVGVRKTKMTKSNYQLAIQQTPVGPNPSRITCPSCHAQVTTRMNYEATTRTHLMALFLCLFL